MDIIITIRTITGPPRRVKHKYRYTLDVPNTYKTSMLIDAPKIVLQTLSVMLDGSTPTSGQV